MKIYNTIIIALFTSLVFVSCNKAKPVEEEPTKGKLNIQFTPSFDTETFEFQKIYTLENGQRIKFENIKIYTSPLTIKNNSGTEVVLADALLFNLTDEKSNFFSELTFGDYHLNEIFMGVDPTFNHNDPSSFQNTHALSYESSTDMHWGWDNGYIFTKIEGKADTTTSGTGLFNQNVVFHIGKDTNYFSKMAHNTFTISKDVERTLTLTLDLAKIFDGPTAIDLIDSPVTHTGDNLPLTTQFINLYKEAIGAKVE